MRTMLTLLLILGLGNPALADAPTEDAAVRAAIEHYFRGHSTGDGAHFRKVFHPEAKLFWIKDGAFAQRPSEEWIAAAKGAPAADEAQRKRTVEWVDITGSAAMVKLRLDYPTVTYTDYMSMLKIDGVWKIVNKTFHGAPRKP
jgi:hypothetical protein